MTSTLLKASATALVLALSTSAVLARTVCYDFGKGPVCYTVGGGLPDARVCFYIDTDFSNRNFCEAGSRTVNDIRDEWKHGIESIQLGPNSSVRVCSEPNLGGTCALYGDSVRELSPPLLNHVYSYRTEKGR